MTPGLYQMDFVFPPISKITHRLRSGAKNRYRENRNKNVQTGEDKNKQLSVAFVPGEAQGQKEGRAMWKARSCGDSRVSFPACSSFVWPLPGRPVLKSRFTTAMTPPSSKRFGLPATHRVRHWPLKIEKNVDLSPPHSLITGRISLLS